MTDHRQQQLGALLREIRRERNVTQRQLAKRVSLSQSAISKYEMGDRALSFLEVTEICRALGVSLRTFCRRWEAVPFLASE